MKSILISGLPGSGKTSVAKILDATDLDKYGYHPEKKVNVWLLPVNLVKWRFVVDGGIYAGICTNMTEISALHWDVRIWIHVSAETLKQRYKDKRTGDHTRLSKWAEGKRPVGRWIEVDGEKPIVDVIKQIRKAMKT